MFFSRSGCMRKSGVGSGQPSGATRDRSDQQRTPRAELKSPNPQIRKALFAPHPNRARFYKLTRKNGPHLWRRRIGRRRREAATVETVGLIAALTNGARCRKLRFMRIDDRSISSASSLAEGQQIRSQNTTSAQRLISCCVLLQCVHCYFQRFPAQRLHAT